MAVYLGLVAAMFFYGFSFILTSLVLQELGPISILLVRISISSILLHLIHAVSTRNRRSVVEKRHLPAFLLVALFQPFLYFMAENFGLSRVSPSVTAIIIGTIPVVTPMIAGPILREKLTRLNVVGLLLSVAGVAVISLDGSGDYVDPAGIVLLFTAVAAAAGYAVAVRRVPQKYDAFTIVRMQNLLGIPMVLPFFLFFERPADLLLASPTSWQMLLLLSVFPSTIAFVLLSNGIRKAGAGRANAFANLIPVFTTLFSIFFLGDPFVLRVWVGMAIVISGVSVAQTRIIPRTGIQEA